MEFFKKITKTAPTSDEPAGSTEPSNTDLFGSAKLLAGAAQDQYTGQTGNYDNAELAGAGSNVLGAASEYGKFDETQGVGKYVNDAEGYLKNYSSTNTKAAPTGGDDVDLQAEVKPIDTPEIEPSVVDDTESGFLKKSGVADDASDVYGKSGQSTYEENTTVDDFPKKVAVKEEEEGGYTRGDTTDDFEKKTYGGGAKFIGSDETETYGDEKAEDFTDKPSGGGDDYTGAVASEVKYGRSEDDQDKEGGFSTKVSDTYSTGTDEISGKFGQDTDESNFEKKPFGGSSYGDQDTEESFEKKPLGGSVDVGEESADGYGQYAKRVIL